LYLEGWLPLILLCAFSAVVVLVMAKGGCLFPFSAIRDFNRDSDKPVRKKRKMSFHLTKIFLASVIILVWIYILKTGNIDWIALSSFLTGLFSFVIAIDEYQRGRRINGHWTLGAAIFITVVSTIHFLLIIYRW
jgi:hypothetical protein